MEQNENTKTVEEVKTTENSTETKVENTAGNAGEEKDTSPVVEFADSEDEKKLALEKGYVEKANKDEVFKYPVARVNDEQGFAEKEEVAPQNGDFVLAVRPEFIQIAESGMFNVEICGAMPTGLESTIKLKIKDYLLTSVVFGGVTFEIGSTHAINFTGSNILLFDRKSGKCITSGSLSK